MFGFGMLNLTEFDFKVSYNTVPCGYTLEKWEQRIRSHCEIYNVIETSKHVLYDCLRVVKVRETLSQALNSV